MIRNLLVTFEEDKYRTSKSERATFEKRFLSIEDAEKLAIRKEDNNCIILTSKIMTVQELDQTIIDEICYHTSKQFTKIHKISNIQIVEYVRTSSNETCYQAFRDYEKIHHEIIQDLEECLLYVLTNKNN